GPFAANHSPPRNGGAITNAAPFETLISPPTPVTSIGSFLESSPLPAAGGAANDDVTRWRKDAGTAFESTVSHRYTIARIPAPIRCFSWLVGETPGRANRVLSSDPSYCASAVAASADRTSTRASVNSFPVKLVR